MNSHRSLPRQIITSAYALVDKMPPLKSEKNPTIAAISGFALGAFGLGLYFGTMADFLVPVAIWIFMTILAVPTGGLAVFSAPVFCAMFGYRRAKSSNAYLGIRHSAIIEAEIVAEQPPLKNGASLTSHSQQFRNLSNNPHVK